MHPGPANCSGEAGGSLWASWTNPGEKALYLPWQGLRGSTIDVRLYFDCQILQWDCYFSFGFHGDKGYLSKVMAANIGMNIQAGCWAEVSSG